MKKLYLLLVLSILALFAACSGDAAISSNTSDNPVATEAEARALLQSWLDEHPFSYPVTINDALTSEDDTGFAFVLYQTDELARIRVVKANGRLLRHNPRTDAFNSIDDWYASLGYSEEQGELNVEVTDVVAVDTSDWITLITENVSISIPDTWEYDTNRTIKSFMW